MAPRFSIIVPVYNREAEVDDLVESLLAQTCKNFELVIAEDGSTEPCEAIVKNAVEYRGLNARYYYKENEGRSIARNYAMERATGDYFIFFDSDCVIPPNYFEVLSAELDARPLDCFGGPDAANDSFSDTQKAINYSTIGRSYMALGRPDSAVYYLALSAIHDLRSNTRETTAAKDLATIMHGRGEVDRAARYLHVAAHDADAYNSRLRKVEINSIMPLIENARHTRLTGQRMILLMASIVFAAMLAAMIFLFFKLKKRNRSLTESHREIREKTIALGDSNTALASLNSQLREATEIKDQYIIQTLYSNTDFVNEVEEKTTRALLKLKGKQYTQLNSILSDMGVRREQARMYASFDSAFLKLFPNFVEEFNRLLQPGQGISLTGGKLPTEVRIFALMRLGITATAEIAQYLCLSVNTVYVYKAKIKARAAVPKGNFEEAVMAIPKP